MASNETLSALALPAGSWSDSRILETLEIRIALAAIRGTKNPVARRVVARLSA
jgi:hypothetical protein